MIYPDLSGLRLNMLPSTDASAFEQLKVLLDREGDNLAGPDWLGMLASIGIMKRKPFTPDERTRKILDQAAQTGFKTARVLCCAEIVNGVSHLMYRDRHWINPFSEGTAAKPSGPLNLSWVNPSGAYLDIDARTGFFSYSWGISPGMLPTRRSKVPFTHLRLSARANLCWVATTIIYAYRPMCRPSCSGM